MKATSQTTDIPQTHSDIDILERLLSMRDAEYADFTAKLIPTIEPKRIIGVRAPQIAHLARELRGTAEAAAFTSALPHCYLEENGLHAALVNLIKDYERAEAEVERLLPYVDNWATCDSLSPSVFGKAAYAGRLHDKAIVWMSSGHEYTCRFGIGILMRHFLDAAFCPGDLDRVAGIDREEYYVKMMQAWYFATALAKQWDAAEPYMHPGRMGEWVRRKAIQKAIESYRVGNRQKALLRSLR